jgi:TatA/E family protein of Tat protein translocase
MGNLSGEKILIILLVALVFLGPEQLPDVARQIGKAMGEVRKLRDGLEREIHDAMKPAPPATPDEADLAPPTTPPQRS